MDGTDRLVRRRKSLKERLGLKGINCCGASWGLVPETMSVRDDEDGEVPQTEITEPGMQSPPGNGSAPACMADTPTGSGMNLAAALAVERQYRTVQDSDRGPVNSPAEGQSQSPVGASNSGPVPAASTPLRMSLMRLLEETDGSDGEKTEKEMQTGSDAMCCVCMVRKKGAAFIPCGHTFCRVCSRELWLNRGSCPLCNRSILEILDIY